MLAPYRETNRSLAVRAVIYNDSRGGYIDNVPPPSRAAAGSWLGPLVDR
jgi:hypothetical protein